MDYTYSSPPSPSSSERDNHYIQIANELRLKDELIAKMRIESRDEFEALAGEFEAVIAERNEYSRKFDKEKIKRINIEKKYKRFRKLICTQKHLLLSTAKKLRDRCAYDFEVKDTMSKLELTDIIIEYED